MKMISKYSRNIKKLLKEYHRKWDCFGNRRNKKKK